MKPAFNFIKNSARKNMQFKFIQLIVDRQTKSVTHFEPKVLLQNKSQE